MFSSGLGEGDRIYSLYSIKIYFFFHHKTYYVLKCEYPTGRKVPAGFLVSSENNLFGKSNAVFAQSTTAMK